VVFRDLEAEMQAVSRKGEAGTSERRSNMTEYDVASPLYSSNHSYNRFHAESTFATEPRSNPFTGTSRAVRTTIERFEAGLDADHEISISLASFGSPVEFRAEEIRFSPSNVVTFHGCTENGEKVQVVQHVSQVSLQLKAVRRLHEKPRRVAFL